MILEFAIGLIIAIVIGFFFGIISGKFFLKIMNWNLKKNVKKFADGNYKNTFNIDGRKYEVDKFKIKDEEGNYKNISLKGGYEIKDGKNEKEISKNSRERIEVGQDNRFVGEDDRSTRKEKRIIGARLRRFG